MYKSENKTNNLHTPTNKGNRHKREPTNSLLFTNWIDPTLGKKKQENIREERKQPTDRILWIFAPDRSKTRIVNEVRVEKLSIEKEIRCECVVVVVYISRRARLEELRLKSKEIKKIKTERSLRFGLDLQGWAVCTVTNVFFKNELLRFSIKTIPTQWWFRSLE